MKSTIISCCFLTLCAAVLVGCSSSVVPLSTNISSLPTNTSTLTLAPARTSTPITTPDLDPQTWLRDFLVTNGNCELPCVLGFQPGLPLSQENTRDIDFIENIGSVYKKMTRGEVYVNHKLDNDILEVSISLRYELDGSNNLETISLGCDLHEEIEDGYKKVFNDERFYQILEKFSPLTIFSQFGNPEQIYIFADLMQIDQPIPYRPFIFLLDYSDNGFLIKAETEGIETDETVSGCIENSHFRFFAFEEGQSVEDIVVNYDFLNTRRDLTPYLPIFEATGIGVDEFSANYLADREFCVVTNMDTWPLP